MINIIIIGQRGHFVEFGNALKEAVELMGHKNVNVAFYLKKQVMAGTQKIAFSKDCNIVCTPQQLDESYILPKNGSIMIWIHTEQKPRAVTYSEWNKVLTFFKDISNETPMEYFPLGYSKHFTTDRRYNQAKAHDLYFFGASTTYRKQITQKYGIHFDKAISGFQRDTTIRNSKINVNIKAYDSNYFFAPLHALHVICQGKLLFQQVSGGDYSLYKPYIVEFTEDNFRKLKKHYLTENRERNQLGKQNLKAMMKNLDFNYTFAECLKGVL